MAALGRFSQHRWLTSIRDEVRLCNEVHRLVTQLEHEAPVEPADISDLCAMLTGENGATFHAWLATHIPQLRHATPTVAMPNVATVVILRAAKDHMPIDIHSKSSAASDQGVIVTQKLIVVLMSLVLRDLSKVSPHARYEMAMVFAGLYRLIGLDTTDLPEVVKRSIGNFRNRSGRIGWAPNSSPQEKDESETGGKNTGNSCWLLAAVQGMLLSSKGVRNAMNRDQVLVDSDSGTLLLTWIKAIMNGQPKFEPAIASQKALMAEFAKTNSRWQGGPQQDACEFLQVFVNEEFQDSTDGTALLNGKWGVELTTLDVCLDCGAQSSNTVRADMLRTLVVGSKDVQLIQLLNENPLKPEEIRKECVKCSAGRTVLTYFPHYRTTSFSPVSRKTEIAIQLSRFNAANQKISTHVKVPSRPFSVSGMDKLCVVAGGVEHIGESRDWGHWKAYRRTGPPTLTGSRWDEYDDATLIPNQPIGTLGERVHGTNLYLLLLRPLTDHDIDELIAEQSDGGSLESFLQTGPVHNATIARLTDPGVWDHDPAFHHLQLIAADWVMERWDWFGDPPDENEQDPGVDESEQEVSPEGYFQAKTNTKKWPFWILRHIQARSNDDWMAIIKDITTIDPSADVLDYPTPRHAGNALKAFVTAGGYDNALGAMEKAHNKAEQERMQKKELQQAAKAAKKEARDGKRQLIERQRVVREDGMDIDRLGLEQEQAIEEIFGLAAATRVFSGPPTREDREALYQIALGSARRMLIAAGRSLDPTALIVNNFDAIMTAFEESDWAAETQRAIRQRIRDQTAALANQHLADYTARLDEHRARCAEEDAQQAERDAKTAEMAKLIRETTERVEREEAEAATKGEAGVGPEKQYYKDLKKALIASLNIGAGVAEEDESSDEDMDHALQEVLLQHAREEAQRKAAAEAHDSVEQRSEQDALTAAEGEIAMLRQQVQQRDEELEKLRIAPTASRESSIAPGQDPVDSQNIPYQQAQTAYEDPILEMERRALDRQREALSKRSGVLDQQEEQARIAWQARNAEQERQGQALHAELKQMKVSVWESFKRIGAGVRREQNLVGGESDADDELLSDSGDTASDTEDESRGGATPRQATFTRTPAPAPGLAGTPRPASGGGLIRLPKRGAVQSLGTTPPEVYPGHNHRSHTAPRPTFPLPLEGGPVLVPKVRVREPPRIDGHHSRSRSPTDGLDRSLLSAADDRSHRPRSTTDTSTSSVDKPPKKSPRQESYGASQLQHEYSPHGSPSLPIRGRSGPRLASGKLRTVSRPSNSSSEATVEHSPPKNHLRRSSGPLKPDLNSMDDGSVFSDNGSAPSDNGRAPGTPLRPQTDVDSQAYSPMSGISDVPYRPAPPPSADTNSGGETSESSSMYMHPLRHETLMPPRIVERGSSADTEDSYRIGPGLAATIARLQDQRHDLEEEFLHFTENPNRPDHAAPLTAPLSTMTRPATRGDHPVDLLGRNRDATLNPGELGESGEQAAQALVDIFDRTETQTADIPPGYLQPNHDGYGLRETQTQHDQEEYLRRQARAERARLIATANDAPQPAPRPPFDADRQQRPTPDPEVDGSDNTRAHRPPIPHRRNFPQQPAQATSTQAPVAENQPPATSNLPVAPLKHKKSFVREKLKRGAAIAKTGIERFWSGDEMDMTEGPEQTVPSLPAFAAPFMGFTAPPAEGASEQVRRSARAAEKKRKDDVQARKDRDKKDGKD